MDNSQATQEIIKIEIMAFKGFMKETDGDVELSLKLTGIFMNSFLSSIMDGARNSKEETKLVNDKLSEFLS